MINTTQNEIAKPITIRIGDEIVAPNGRTYEVLGVDHYTDPVTIYETTYANETRIAVFAYGDGDGREMSIIDFYFDHNDDRVEVISRFSH